MGADDGKWVESGQVSCIKPIGCLPQAETFAKPTQ
jgi:hypothetical protein